MTLTLELPAELESALAQKAAQRGVPLDALILDAVTQYAAREENDATRRLRARDLLGKYAHLNVSSEDVHRRRREEVERDEENLARRFPRQERDAA